ncbi:prepilin peptidase [Brevundimonas sp. Root1423]|uniref:A24 family peptidase n=1 Tax=Brevundimonas sp. Root1423 TaxID=1736462 RepID=UPI0006FB0CF1|nr:prepilin peptidase [Brevundimonas sp. Root1423]KQY89579.1 pilus assembly protein CpaA [Brevundimonas sp. Root1423]
MEFLIPLLLVILPALVIAAALTDITSMTIPNWISGAAILSFFPTAFLLGLPGGAILMQVGVGVLALLVGMAFFALRFLGGGDAKLMAAVSLWMGTAGVSVFVLATAVIGGLFGLLLVLARQYARPHLAAGPAWFTRLMEPKGDIPYGVAIAAGALVAYPASPLVAAFIAA